jgi:hypothetical protein
MVRLSKKLVLSSVGAMLVVGGGWMWLGEATAARPGANLPSPGITASCPGVRDPDISINGGPFVAADTAGSISATAGATTKTPDGRQTTRLIVNNTYTSGRVEGVGDLAITLDTSRTPPPSSLTANQTGQAFPATQTMRFFPVFILNGEVFNSADAAELVNSSVTSFPPRPGTVYVLTKHITLTSQEGNSIDVKPGRAFTISNGF